MSTETRLLRRISLLCCALVALLASCKSTSAPAAAASDEYVLVYLLTGPRADELTPDEVAEATAGHFTNMTRLGEAGALLVAGPLPDPRVDPLHRGIFVFDVATTAEADALAATDPGVVAGMFATQALPLRTAAPLRTLHARHLELAAEAGEDWMKAMRAYVLASAPDAQHAFELMAAPAAAERVFFAATLGKGADERALFALDATSVEEARALIVLGDPRGELDWALSPWFATRAVAELPAAPAPGS